MRSASTPVASPSARVLAIALLALGGCGGDGAGEGADGAPRGVVAEDPLPDVVGAKLAEYGVAAVDGEGEVAPELRDDTGTLPAGVAEDGSGTDGAESGGAAADGSAPDAPATDEDPEAGLSEDVLELRDGLVEMVLSRPRMLSIALGDVEAAGEEMPRALSAALRDDARSAEELRVLVDLAKAQPSAEVARALEHVATFAPDASLRGYAASSILDHLDAPGADAVLPGIVKRQKYERAEGVMRWIDGTVDAVRARLAGGAGPSRELRAELWRIVSKLSGEHFQLRGVDDARFVLARLGPWAARELALALGDRDAYVRLHTAQVLERMGADGAPAVDALEAALSDRDHGVAGQAAEALTVVAAASGKAPLIERAEAALLQRLDDRPPYEVRVALARALSKLPGGGPTERLRQLFDDAPGSDMRLAAAEGLLKSEADRPAALTWLSDELEARVGDPAGAEALLEAWLRGGGGPDGLLEAWLTHAPPAAVIHTSEQARARRAARAALVRERAL